MRSFRFVPLLVLIAFAKSATAQQAATPSPQATALLQQALTALSGGHSLADVTLSGAARRIAGSDDESGTAVLKARAAGEGRMDLTLPGGNRSEVLSTSSSAEPAGVWSGTDGVSHPIVYHNLLSPPAWFFPAFTVARGLSAGYVANYIGPETRSGRAVVHLAVSQVSTIAVPSYGPSFAHLSQIDFFLDATTFLPAAITFNIHPDDNALLDVPVEIGFSSYTPVSGSQVPFHIQKYINNTLTLDLQFESASLNSGLSAATFTVGAGL
jgi:hypothetical protein